MSSPDEALGPPVPRIEPVRRTLHGVTRIDDYAWMREVDADATIEHLRAERAWYDAASRHLAPLTRTLTAEIVARIPPTERGVSVDRSRCVYYTQVREGREHGEIRRFQRPSVARSTAGSAENDELVLDIDAERGNSDFVELGVCELSPDESLLAYSVDLAGDEVYELRFRDLSTGLDLPDRIDRSYYTGAWSSAGDSFFYTVHDDAYRPFQVRRHLIGSPAGDDVVVLTESDDQYEVSVRGCRSGRLIVITVENRDTTEEWLVDPADPSAPARRVQPRQRGVEYRVEHAPTPDGEDRLLVLTNHQAPEFTVLTAPVADPGAAQWRPLLPYDADDRTLDVDAFADCFVVTLRREWEPRLRVHAADGRLLHEVLAPPCGQVTLGENPRWDAPTIVVERYSHVLPPVWYDVDLATGTEQVRHAAAAPGFDPAAYTSERVLVPARDGTEVPVTLVRRVDVPLDGTAPCLVYGYGAYEAVFEPEYDPAITVLLDHGVVFAQTGIRGGGEGGRRWWLDGHLEHKHHTFEDHIDVAEAIGGTLVDGTRLASRGLSAGGLLQGAVFSQRPDLWRAVIAEVPFVDVVTTMLDATIPLTANEWDEWGDPRRAEDFAWMLAYSPYDNLPPAGGRPDLLVTGAVHDARVMVWEPAKWVAALRAGDPDWAPRCLFRVDTGAGAHTGPSGRYARAGYEAEIYAWLLDRLS